jgi:hypothetical protein
VYYIFLNNKQQVTNMSQYTDNGFKNRQDYLQDLADENGIDMDTVLLLADLLGEEEDFDGLVTNLQDFSGEF